MERHELPVKVGQVWESTDAREAKRHRRIRILALLRKNNVSMWYAEVENVQTGRCATIRADRFRPYSTGYKLVSEAPQQ